MITIPYLYIVALLIVIWAIYRILVLKKSKEKNVFREIIINIFFVYFLVVINLTICKMGMLHINFQNRFYINYIPFVETIKMFKENFMGIGNALYNVIGNVVLFVPLGFFIPMLFKNKNKIAKIALYGFIASLAIEMIQLLTAINLTDIDDIIFNTTGAILGFFIFNVFYYLVKKTKLGELVRRVWSKFDGNLVVLSIKPLSIMFVAVLIFTIVNVFNATMPEDTSNEDIAKSVFQYSNNSYFEEVKEVPGYKIFLKDEGSYVDLMSVQKVLNNRWFDNKMGIGQYTKANGDYSIATIYDDIREENTSITVAVFGKNKDAAKVEIIFNGKIYSENMKPNDYFLVAFPTFETLGNNDIDNSYKGEESKDLKIRFIDKNGDEYNEMKVAK